MGKIKRNHKIESSSESSSSSSSSDDKKSWKKSKKQKLSTDGEKDRNTATSIITCLDTKLIEIKKELSREAKKAKTR